MPTAVEHSESTAGSNGKEQWTCAALDLPEGSLAVNTDPESIGRRYDLEGVDASVTSSLLGLSSNYRTVDDALARVDAGIDECLDEQADSLSRESRLSGVPDDAVGYRSVAANGEDRARIEKIYAPSGEDRIVVVAVEWDGTDDPPTRAADLLPTALDRADEGDY